MKKLMLLLSALALCGSAFAGAITVTTNVTATMIVPPVVPLTLGTAQYADRGDTGTVATVAMGEYRRIGDALAIAANSGTISGVLTTNTVITSGGTFYGTNSISGYIVTNVVVATTNKVITRAAIYLPLTGLSAIDGSVYWLRVPQTRGPVQVQARIPLAEATVTITDSAGGITVLHSDYEKELFSSGRALYARADGTNTCTVTQIEP